jgi:DNA-binding transcriptional LysR family regulator
MLDDLRTSISECEFLPDPAAGRRRIGSTEAMATTLLPMIIDRMARRCPRMTFEVALADSKTLTDRDLRGQVARLGERKAHLGAPADSAPTASVDMRRIRLAARTAAVVGLRRYCVMRALTGSFTFSTLPISTFRSAPPTFSTLRM